MPCCAVARVIEHSYFNSTPDPFNGQAANFISKPPKVIESRSYVKKANLDWSAIGTTLHCSITLATAKQGKSESGSIHI